MAVLNNIRKRSFFLIIIIALALFSFVLADLFRSGGFGGNKAQKVIGEVNGEEIKTSEFQSLVENASGGRGFSMQSVKNAWTQQVNGLLVGQQVDKAGIRVDSEHLKEALSQNLGNNPTFQNEEGTFEYSKVQEFVAEMKDTDPQRYNTVWVNLENANLKQAAQDIYFTMIKSGVGITDKEGQLAHQSNNDKIDIKYVRLPYSSIIDSTIPISKSEIKDYITSHENTFKTNESVDIEYVKIDEVASLEDEKNITKELEGLRKSKEVYNSVIKAKETILGFESTKNVEEFVNENSAIKYANKFQFKKDLNKELVENLFDAEIGEIYGAYKESGYIKLSKLVETTKMPDSAKASHILIAWEGLRTGQGVTRTKEEAKILADSIKTAVSNSKKVFGDLAIKYSADKSNSEKAGDLGYFTPGRMVPAFNDYVFENKVGSIDVIETQFGYHVISIEDQKNEQKAVKIATIAHKIEPSETTINEVYANATKFVTNSRNNGFSEEAKKANYTIKPITKINELDENISGVGKQRSIVRWAFNKETKVGTIKNFDLPSGYVIVKLTSKTKEGIQTVEDASVKVIPILRDKKKANLLKAKISGTDLNSIAKTAATTVKTASGITMKNATISGAGIEKKVVGTAFGLDLNKISAPIEGSKGIYVVEVTSKTPGQTLASYQGVANKNAQSEITRAQSATINALKEKAKIKDRRAELY